MNIGILGGGQLGKMLAMAGIPLGMRASVLDPSADPCASTVAAHIRAQYDDLVALSSLGRRSDVVTYEFENTPVSALEALLLHAPVRPGPQSLRVLQDRLTEKRLFRSLGIATPDFEPVGSLDELRAAIHRLGFPVVAKSRRWGYDGKGQSLIREPIDVDRAWESLGGQDLIVERFVQFDREVAIIGVRSLGGTCVFYQAVESHHVDGVLRWVVPVDDARLQREAEACAGALLDALDHVGALGFEFFQTAGGLMANEAAPRVHNTGHWTTEGSRTSQFENHLRAIAGLPLGDTTTNGFVGFVNYIGRVPPVSDVLAVRGAHHHEYGKAPHPGRKVGHATVVTQDAAARDESLKQLRDLISVHRQSQTDIPDRQSD